MQDQPIGPDAARLSNEVEFVVLAVLLDPECPGAWSVDELAREVGCESGIDDEVARLQRHRSPGMRALASLDGEPGFRVIDAARVL